MEYAMLPNCSYCFADNNLLHRCKCIMYEWYLYASHNTINQVKERIFNQITISYCYKIEEKCERQSEKS